MMSLDRKRLRCPLVLVWDADDAWGVAKQHPVLHSVGKYSLSVYARVFRCRRHGGHVILFNEDDGECGLFIVGKVSRSSIEWVVPIAGLLGYTRVIFITDRPELESMALRIGYVKDKDGFMAAEVWSE